MKEMLKTLLRCNGVKKFQTKALKSGIDPRIKHFRGTKIVWKGQMAGLQNAILTNSPLYEGTNSDQAGI